MRITDNGYRYWNQRNQQCTSARTSNANALALIDIMAMTVTELKPDDCKNPHPWLLVGTEEATRKIHGDTGLCPKLLHMFAQITHLCGLMIEDGQSIIIPLAAKELEKKLKKLRQWSELSPNPAQNHASAESLIESCQLNEQGLVTTEREVTDLGAEAWVQAARIYLQFRFFRSVKHTK
jgi:hypothetical protein